jgi:general secretion pathway protein D
VVGQLFRTNTDVLNRTELIILITPYVITNDEEAGAVTDAFRRQLTGDWVKTD